MQYAIQPFTFGEAIQRAVYSHLDRRDQLQRDEALGEYRRAQINLGREGNSIRERARQDASRQATMSHELAKAEADRAAEAQAYFQNLNPLYNPTEEESLFIGAQQDLGEMGLNEYLGLVGQAEQRDLYGQSVAQQRRANDIAEMTQEQIIEAMGRGYDTGDAIEVQPLPRLEQPKFTDRVAAGFIGTAMRSTSPGVSALGRLLAPLMPSTDEMYGTTGEAREQQYLGRFGSALSRVAADTEGMLPDARRAYLEATPQGQETAEDMATLMRLAQQDPALGQRGLGLVNRMDRDFRRTFGVKGSDYAFPQQDPVLGRLLEGAEGDEKYGDALRIYQAMNGQ